MSLFGAGAPAAGSSGFSFAGGAAVTTAPATNSNAFSFQNSAPAPGSAPFGAPATSAFGTAPAAAPSTSLFGGTGGGFGTTAPSTTFGGFGSTPAAPANTFGSMFSSPSPAPFGSPTPAFGGGGFSAQQQQQQQAFQHRPAAIAGKMTYSQLPDDMKKRIDQVHQNMMDHKRTMNMVATMAPHRLQNRELSNRVAEYQRDSTSIEQELHSLNGNLRALQADAEETLRQIVAHAMWPTEALVVRAGLRHSDEEKKDDSQQQQQEFQRQVRAALDRQMISVDRIDRMPSPYLIATIQNQQARVEQLSLRAQQLQEQHEFLKQLVSGPENNQHFTLASMAHHQNTVLFRVSQLIKQVHQEVGEVSRKYARVERGNNVLDQARAEDWHRQRLLEDEAQKQYLNAASADATPTTQGQANPFGGQAPAPSALGTNLFAGGQAPAPSGLFGAPSAAAPASSAFGFTNSAPASGLNAFGGGTTSGAPAPPPSGQGVSFGGASTFGPSPGISRSSSKTRNKSSRTGK
jgi:hypothetical protein